ncbi:MAG: hypothetical protein WAV20_18985 [Blastocatellia bacterium]
MINAREPGGEPNHRLPGRGAPGIDRETLVIELQRCTDKLNEQSRIFIPLIALVLIASIPVWSKSPLRFLILLASPFVLLPLGFCVAHLLLAWRRIATARNRIRKWDNSNGHEPIHK